MTKISVLLVDDHTVVREGFRMLLETADGFEVLGEASDGLRAVEMAMKLRPAVVVMDLAMPKLNGLEASRRIIQQVKPVPKILVLSAHSDDAYIKEVSLLGVPGYLVKQTSAKFLIKAIREIHQGKTYYSQSISLRLCNHHHKNASGKRTRRGRIIDERLTSRERQVLQLVAEGRSNKEVAMDLDISVKTVEKHRQKVMDKLNIHDTSGLTRYAISAGIIENSVQCTIK